MTKFEDQLDFVYANDRACWRQWLEKHHQTAIGAWLIYYKVTSGKPSVQYSEAVQEALCFGWIDSKVKSLDAERYQQIFTPRKPNSVWSKLNKSYVENLIAQGLMTKAGLEIIHAKQNGSWLSLDDVEALLIPKDLMQALERNPTAIQNFVTLSNTTKKNILQWLQSAKRPGTRLSRIETIVNAAAQNKNPLARSPSI
jgi:uncharacterized protein YdeI (YjbR/CyaY-like superfamily)